MTTAAWAADWVRYTRELRALDLDPYCVPSWRCGGPEERARRHRLERERRGGRHENSTGGTLDAAARRALGVSSGFCAITTAGGSCTSDARGATPLKKLLAHVEPPHHWRKALKACRRFCQLCANCNYVTVSLANDDCSWYRECNLDALDRKYDGFYSSRVVKKAKPAVTPRLLPEAHAPSKQILRPQPRPTLRGSG